MAKVPPQFVAYILEQMHDLEAVRARSMFGGWGIYWDDFIIALALNDVLYFKADAKNRADFEALKLEPFTYEAKGKIKALSYFRAPEEVFDDCEAMETWAQSARKASERAAKKRRFPVVKTQSKTRKTVRTKS